MKKKRLVIWYGKKQVEMVARMQDSLVRPRWWNLMLFIELFAGWIYHIFIFAQLNFDEISMRQWEKNIQENLCFCCAKKCLHFDKGFLLKIYVTISSRDWFRGKILLQFNDLLLFSRWNIRMLLYVKKSLLVQVFSKKISCAVRIDLRQALYY